jgi:hypothetical protein
MITGSSAVSVFKQARTGVVRQALGLAVMALLAGCSTSTPLPALDEEYGFKGLKFETDTSAVPGLVPVRWESVTDDIIPPRILDGTYIRPTDTLTAWGYPVRRIAYTFYRGKLSCVFITVQGGEIFSNIVRAMQASYGEGEGTFGLASNERLWIGKKVEVDTHLYNGGLPDYYVPNKEIYTFNIASLVVRQLIEKDEQLVLASDSAQATHDRND